VLRGAVLRQVDYNHAPPFGNLHQIALWVKAKEQPTCCISYVQPDYLLRHA
jgi:hypothetical protein